MITVLLHPDGVSGTTVLAEGSLVHWAGGPRANLPLRVIYKDGKKEWVESCTRGERDEENWLETARHPIEIALDFVEKHYEGKKVIRHMSTHERYKWEEAHGG